jgi:hypothetical protein
VFIRRRRPLLRAALVGGVAYHAGKKVEQGREQEAMTDARLDQLEAGQAAPAAGGLSDAAITHLQKLAELRDQGVLTPDEFEQQKQRLLQGS